MHMVTVKHKKITSSRFLHPTAIFLFVYISPMAHCKDDNHLIFPVKNDSIITHPKSVRSYVMIDQSISKEEGIFRQNIMIKFCYDPLSDIGRELFEFFKRTWRKYIDVHISITTRAVFLLLPKKYALFPVEPVLFYDDN